MYNRAILVGRLTADPELRQTPSGIAVTSFSIACDRPGKEKQTDFIDIVAWRQTAEFICRYFSKGKAILVEGPIQVRSYEDKAGQKRRTWEVIADNARFVEGKNASQDSSKTHQSANLPAAPTYSSSSVEDFAEIDGDDSDIPF